MALSGDTGCGGAHLHFATKNNGTPFDPYAGSTNWVSGQPIPMGFRDQNGDVSGYATTSIVIHNSDDDKVRDSRMRSSLLEPGGQWVVNVHTILYDWLISDASTWGTFNGYAYVYADQPVTVYHNYSTNTDCLFEPAIMLNAYPPPP
jgi:hypothetical protein